MNRDYLREAAEVDISRPHCALAEKAGSPEMEVPVRVLAVCPSVNPSPFLGLHFLIYKGEHFIRGSRGLLPTLIVCHFSAD